MRFGGSRNPTQNPVAAPAPAGQWCPGAVAEASGRLVETQVSGLPILQVWGVAMNLLTDAAGPGTTLRSEVPLGSRPTLLGLLVKLSPLLPASPGPFHLLTLCLCQVLPFPPRPEASRASQAEVTPLPPLQPPALQ